MVTGSAHLAVVKFVDKANCKKTLIIFRVKVLSPVDNVNIIVGYLYFSIPCFCMSAKYVYVEVHLKCLMYLLSL